MKHTKIRDSKETLTELFNQTDFPYNPKNSVHELFSNKKIVLYGSGSGFTTFLLLVLNKYKFKAFALLDKKFNKNTTCWGIPACHPTKYKPTTDERDNAVVVITVGKKKYHKEIFNSLRGLGFKNVILATDIYEYHLHYPSNELQKKGFRYFLENKNNILTCINLLADDLSRDVYVKFIQTHMLRKPIQIPHRPLKEQYFPKDMRLSKNAYSRFVNCGSYRGETLAECNKLYGKLNTVVCFEPDPINFKTLTTFLSANYDSIAESIVAFPCGVFKNEIQLHFLSGYETNSTISDKGNSIIQCVSLDHVIPNFRPTFITMDIEGAELDALKGAEQLIKNNRPNLAISVYHVPNHIWDIPLYLNSLKQGYKFYLRNYTSYISETICYAIMNH